MIDDDIHRDCSETYGPKNTRAKVSSDADDFEAAIESNLDALEPCLGQ